MNKRLKQSAGFSMVEVMIVVGIMGILIAAAIPEYHLFTAKSKRTEAYLTLRSLDIAERVYFANHETFKSLPNILGITDTMVWNALELESVPMRYYEFYGPVIFGCSKVPGGPVVSYCVGVKGNIDHDDAFDVIAIQNKTPGCPTPCSALGGNGVPIVYMDDFIL